MVADEVFVPRRVRYQVSSAAPLNYAMECHRLMEQLKQFNLQPANDNNNSLFVN